MTAIVCMALSAAGVVIAVLAGVRGRIRSAFRWLGVALVPVGLYLTGLITVFRRIGTALSNWATHLVFDPKVWTGLAMLGAAVLLLLATGIGRRSREPGPVKASKQPKAAKGGSSAPAVTAKPAGQKSAADDLGDFSDVEEILKRRGI
ncbi:hypothetical protein [Streptacidiphilus carbonis]|uniref:hypothetical protein n=1 Tax=Streptacidiphilus carbonis TaxID=105422 RepID=UPI0005A6A241|nr:hypothetical protein [Streptacidiphilus carbonis]